MKNMIKTNTFAIYEYRIEISINFSVMKRRGRKSMLNLCVVRIQGRKLINDARAGI